MLALSLGILWLTTPRFMGTRPSCSSGLRHRNRCDQHRLRWLSPHAHPPAPSPSSSASHSASMLSSRSLISQLFYSIIIILWYVASRLQFSLPLLFPALPVTHPLPHIFLFPSKKRVRDRNQTWHNKMQYLAHTIKSRLDKTTQYILSYFLRISKKVSDLTTKFSVFLFLNLCRPGSLSLSLHPKVLFYFGLHLCYFGALVFLIMFPHLQWSLMAPTPNSQHVPRLYSTSELFS